MIFEDTREGKFTRELFNKIMLKDLVNNSIFKASIRIGVDGKPKKIGYSNIRNTLIDILEDNGLYRTSEIIPALYTVIPYIKFVKSLDTGKTIGVWDNSSVKFIDNVFDSIRLISNTCSPEVKFLGNDSETYTAFLNLRDDQKILRFEIVGLSTYIEIDLGERNSLVVKMLAGSQYAVISHIEVNSESGNYCWFVTKAEYVVKVKSLLHIIKTYQKKGIVWAYDITPFETETLPIIATTKVATNTRELIKIMEGHGYEFTKSGNFVKVHDGATIRVGFKSRQLSPTINIQKGMYITVETGYIDILKFLQDPSKYIK